MRFYWYPKCSTCVKAYKHLKEMNVELDVKHIVEQTPTKEEMKMYIELYAQGIKPFFNTSGKLYKEMNMKEKVGTMNVDEAAELLSSHGMLVKRPLLVNGNQIIVGYKKEIYDSLKEF
jgi:arsenate reductase